MKIGLATPDGLWASDLDGRREMLANVAAAGVDHVFMADHVSFRNGSGTDGFVEIAGLSQLHPTLGVMISIYLLPLRHPVPVARQLATVNRLAPGRVADGPGLRLGKRRLGIEPGIEIGLLFDDDLAAHREVGDSAKLLTKNFVGTRL